jgi:hypothetical protein
MYYYALLHQSESGSGTAWLKFNSVKRIYFLFAILLSAPFLHAQNVLNYGQIKLDIADGYGVADTFVLESANTLLPNSIDDGQLERLKCQQFINKWMPGNPDDTFTFEESTKLLNNDRDLIETNKNPELGKKIS